MTANQIAYQGLKLDERRVDIAGRAQDESERHNREDERLKGDANAINDFAARVDAQYKNDMTALTREYNQNSLALKKAQGDEALRIQARQADIEELKAWTEKSYKEDMANVARTQADISASIARENARHNETMESLNAASQIIESDKVSIQRKQLEFQDRKLETESGLRQQEIDNARLNTLYGGYNVLTQSKRLTFDMMRYNQSEKGLQLSQTWGNIMKGMEVLIRPFEDKLLHLLP